MEIPFTFSFSPGEKPKGGTRLVSNLDIRENFPSLALERAGRGDCGIPVPGGFKLHLGKAGLRSGMAAGGAAGRRGWSIALALTGSPRPPISRGKQGDPPPGRSSLPLLGTAPATAPPGASFYRGGGELTSETAQPGTRGIVPSSGHPNRRRVAPVVPTDGCCQTGGIPQAGIRVSAGDCRNHVGHL